MNQSPMDRATVTGSDLELLLALARGNRVLELGSAYGHSAIELCSVAARVVSVDWHRGAPWTVPEYSGGWRRLGSEDSAAVDEHGETWTLPPFWARTRAERDSGRLIAMVGRTETILPLLAPRSFDLIFHDADHTAQGVARDLRLALPLLSSGGYIAAHDYGLFGVREGSLPIIGEPDLVGRSLAVWGPARDNWRSEDEPPADSERGAPL